MSVEEQLELAKQIYAFKVVMCPSWDLQKIARESFSMATQFFLAVQAERAGSSTDSHSSNPSGTGSPGTSSSSTLPQEDSTTDKPKQSATDSTAAAEKGSGTAPPADTGWSHTQSQEQFIPGIQEAPFAPYYPNF